MNKIFFSVLIALIIITNVSATGPLININITGNNITVKGYITYDTFGKYSAPVITDFADTINCITNSTGNVSFLDCSNVNYARDIPLINQQNNSLVVMTDASQQAYNQCLKDKAMFEAGLNSCVASKNENNKYYENYTKCNADLIVCNGDKSLAVSTQQEAETKYNDSLNTKYIWSAVCTVLAILGTLWYKGDIGRSKIKKVEEKFNLQQSG